MDRGDRTNQLVEVDSGAVSDRCRSHDDESFASTRFALTENSAVLKKVNGAYQVRLDQRQNVISRALSQDERTSLTEQVTPMVFWKIF